MNVRLRIQFKSPGDAQLAAMRFLAQSLTNSPNSVRVFADDPPSWLVAEFTIPTEPQYTALSKIERAIRFWASERLDSAIGFPMTEAERARAGRKAAKRRARRGRAT